ncbi:ATP-binding protein [Streptomyces boninensis]|uniref:ATP-binding protein n=1 Tax=Streptomyces boninensis TaxID=2039455 RepID=UPI003B213313
MGGPARGSQGREVQHHPHADWVGAFGDATVAAAMLDRLLRRAAVACIDGPSCRLRGHRSDMGDRTPCVNPFA